jgi:hypothetical protein
MPLRPRPRHELLRNEDPEIFLKIGVGTPAKYHNELNELRTLRIAFPRFAHTKSPCSETFSVTLAMKCECHDVPMISFQLYFFSEWDLDLDFRYPDITKNFPRICSLEIGCHRFSIVGDNFSAFFLRNCPKSTMGKGTANASLPLGRKPQKCSKR